MTKGTQKLTQVNMETSKKQEVNTVGGGEKDGELHDMQYSTNGTKRTAVFDRPKGRLVLISCYEGGSMSKRRRRISASFTHLARIFVGRKVLEYLLALVDMLAF